jgi:hypothetical protein
MLRTVLTGGLLALLALITTGEALARDGYAPIPKKPQKQEGKLIKEVYILEGRPLPGVEHDYRGFISRPSRTITMWKLQVGKKFYTLALGSDALKRLAVALEGHDVVVTGPLKDGNITVRDMESKPAVFVGTLVQSKGLPVVWKLVTDKGEFQLINEDADAVKRWTHTPVIVNGKLTSRGIVVTSVEPLRFPREIDRPLVSPAR